MHVHCAGLDDVPRGKWLCPTHRRGGKATKARVSAGGGEWHKVALACKPWFAPDHSHPSWLSCLLCQEVMGLELAIQARVTTALQYSSLRAKALAASPQRRSRSASPQKQTQISYCVCHLWSNKLGGAPSLMPLGNHTMAPQQSNFRAESDEMHAVRRYVDCVQTTTTIVLTWQLPAALSVSVASCHANKV